MKKMLIGFGYIITVALLYTSCTVPPTYHVLYDIHLVGVERPANAEERYGAVAITSSDTSRIGSFVFEDELVRIVWIFTSRNLSFDMTNKTSHSIKILWDEAAYAEADGKSHRVFHTGIRYSERDRSQPPTVVIRGGRVTESIVPTSYIDYVGIQSGRDTSWKERPFFLPVRGRSRSELKILSEQHKGSRIHVLLPLEIEGTVNEYLFAFEVANILLKDTGSTISDRKYTGKMHGDHVRARVSEGIKYNGFIYKDDDWLEGTAVEIRSGYLTIKMKAGDGIVRVPLNTLIELQTRRTVGGEWLPIEWKDGEDLIRSTLGLRE